MITFNIFGELNHSYSACLGVVIILLVSLLMLANLLGVFVVLNQMHWCLKLLKNTVEALRRLDHFKDEHFTEY